MSTSNSPPTPSPPTYSAGPPRTNPLHWVLLILGVLLTMLGLILSVLGAVALSAESTQRDGQYITFETQEVQTTGYALVTPSVTLDLDEGGDPQLPSSEELASVRVRVTSIIPDQEIFVGIGPADEVSTYLQSVPYSSLEDMSWQTSGFDMDWPSRSDVRIERVTEGTETPTDPTAEAFWVQSASGSGAQEVTWDLEPGEWSLVIMNADASRPVWVEIQPGVRSDVAEQFTGAVGPGLLLAGLLTTAVGIVLLLFGARGLGRSIDRGPAGAAGGYTAVSSVYPARLTGHLDPSLSRWLWLVKWLLAIPHYIVLALLSFALVVTTIASGIAILFTARYPRSWFMFSVGVLRWSWRVGFYTYSALGTDRYPPFTLASADYPADFDVPYPERLSRGLVLVKWWLLAIPHFIIVGIFTGGIGATWGMSANSNTQAENIGWTPSLLSVLVLLAAVMLLFTGRYRAGLFALIMGINRWVYRTLSYVMLLRDNYPPFRLDQGPVERPIDDPDPAGISGSPPGQGPGPSPGT